MKKESLTDSVAAGKKLKHIFPGEVTSWLTSAKGKISQTLFLRLVFYKASLTYFGFLACLPSVPAAQISIPALADGEIAFAGALGLTTDTTRVAIQTSRSGGNNIHRGVFLFELAPLPEHWSLSSASFSVTTSSNISNTSSPAPVEFHGFASNGTIEDSDFDVPTSSVGSLMTSENFEVGASSIPPHTSLSIGLTGIDPIRNVIASDSDHFMLRTETINFVNFVVHSLDNTEGRGVPTLILTGYRDADFNQDDQVDCDDVDSLVTAIATGSGSGTFDLTGDGTVTRDDLDEWLVQAGAINLASGNSYPVGDANLDGSVDVSDFNVWNDHKFTNETRWCAGNFNLDGSVDVSDFNVWNDNKFTTSDLQRNAVPEPDSIYISWLGLAGLMVFLRKLRT